MQPKAENSQKGYYYFVSEQMIEAHRGRSVKEIFDWLESANKFVFAVQNPEERQHTRIAGNFSAAS